jgi:hypothetical protein
MNRLDDWGTRLDIPSNGEEAQAFLHWIIHDLKVCLRPGVSLSDYVNAKGERRFTTYEVYTVGMILEVCRHVRHGGGFAKPRCSNPFDYRLGFTEELAGMKERYINALADMMEMEIATAKSFKFFPRKQA